MLAFRSEGHLEHWLATEGLPRGAAFPLAVCLELARRWYEGRLATDWRPRTREGAEAVLRSVGLEGPFWRLA